MLRQSQTDIFSPQEPPPILQPALAWIAVLGFAFCSLIAILIGAGKILNFAFPAGAFAVGVFLYRRYPILYLGFSWWIYFLTPLVRRLVDYHTSFTSPSPILLAPLLVALITLDKVCRYLPKAHRHGGLPFVFSIAGVGYGLLIGLTQDTIVIDFVSTLEWLSPVLLGFYIFVNWRDYPSYRQNLERTFVWAVFLTGVYGIFQYLIAPEWDRFWVINSEFTTAGIPEPLGIRIWSTMNSPLVFAIMIMAGLLVLLSYRGALLIPASVFGYLAFLLSLVRTAWGGWVVGLLTLVTSLRPKFQMRLIIIITIMALCVVPLIHTEPFSEVINTRLETVTSLEDDGSGRIRQETYGLLLMPALTSVLGYGFGNVPDFGRPLDSTILSTLFTLGWIGTLLYMGGWLLLAFGLFRKPASRNDPFISTARAIVIGGLFMFPLGHVTIGLPGAVLWGFLGIGIAAQKYYHYQSNGRNKRFKNF